MAMPNSDRRCFAVEYKCKGFSPGRSIVVAYNAKDALHVFLKNWDSKYKAGEIDISSDELENIEVIDWCDWFNLIGRL